jgi:hypothetical protein
LLISCKLSPMMKTRLCAELLNPDANKTIKP